MASLIFSHAKSIYNRAQKYANDIGTQACLNCDEDERSEIYQEAFEKSYAMMVDVERKKFAKILTIASALHNDYMGIASKDPSWYMITIRPDTSKVTFSEFYDKIHTLMERKIWLQYTLSFEQKGTTEETLGDGFHVHIVSETSHRSKGECLRDLLSSFKKWINKGMIQEQCIDVKVSKTPDKIIQDYMIEYKSEDGHKEQTMETDKLWREKHNLQPVYKDHVPKRISLTNKPVTVRDISSRIMFN